MGQPAAEQTSSPSEEAPRVEITVQSLHGISVPRATERDAVLPHVTATIAFAGSAEDMKVGSSTLCGMTGQLVIESQVARIDLNRQASLGSSNSLTAKWRDEQTLEHFQPHLTVSLPESHPRAQKIPLSTMNRDSHIVKEVCDLEACDTVSTASISLDDSSPAPPPRSQIRGGSAVWSNSGAEALPEIVELYIRLKTSDGSTDGQVWQGIAYLVVFGHREDKGTYVMDLPVKKPARSDPSSASSNTSIKLAPDARLRVRVKVTPNEIQQSRVVSPEHKLASLPCESSEEVHMSRSLFEGQIEELVDKIRRNEEEALKYAHAQKNAMDVNVPMHGNELEEPEHLCDGIWSWFEILQTLSSAVTSCDSRAAADGAPDESNVSTCSTIATRESLNI